MNVFHTRWNCGPQQGLVFVHAVKHHHHLVAFDVTDVQENDFYTCMKTLVYVRTFNQMMMQSLMSSDVG